MNVLLSIKPKYVEEILKGNKKYEFRKVIFKCREELGMVYIYYFGANKKGFAIDERRFNNQVSVHPRLKFGLCALCVPCGEIKICTAKSAKNAKGGAINGCS